MANRWVLEGCVIERTPVRYTPAGIPITHCLLHHCSQVEEAGIARQIEMNISAVAAGALSDVLEHCLLNQAFRFTGFIAPRGRRTSTWEFHITGVEAI